MSAHSVSCLEQAFTDDAIHDSDAFAHILRHVPVDHARVERGELNRHGRPSAWTKTL
jgi:hypothetical protein